MVGVRDLESKEEFEPTERRLGARELERGDDEADEGVSDRGEVVLRFLIGTLSLVKRVNCTCPRPEFRSGESLSVRFEVGVDSFAVVSCCSCCTMSLGCDTALLFFLVSGDSTLGVVLCEDTVIRCLAIGDPAGEDGDLVCFCTGFGEWVTGNSVFHV